MRTVARYCGLMIAISIGLWVSVLGPFWYAYDTFRSWFGAPILNSPAQAMVSGVVFTFAGGVLWAMNRHSVKAGSALIASVLTCLLPLKILLQHGIEDPFKVLSREAPGAFVVTLLFSPLEVVLGFWIAYVVILVSNARTRPTGFPGRGFNDPESNTATPAQ